VTLSSKSTMRRAPKRSPVQVFRTRILTLPRRVKQLSMIATDTIFYSLSVALSMWIVYGSVGDATEFWRISAVTIAAAVPILWVFGLYASIVRYIGFELFRTGLMSTFLVATALFLLNYWAGRVDAPLRAGIVFWAISLILIIGSRFLARVFLLRRNQNRELVIVYGAGEAGARLIADLLAGDDYLPVAVLDDNREMLGKRVHGLRVKAPERLAELVGKYEVASVLLAIPSASRRARRQVLETISAVPVRVQTMPGISDIVSGKARVDDIRAVEIEDLLGRNPVPPDNKLLRASTSGKNVLVTGAGGSIGSELCKQILLQQPRQLILFDISEPSLYQIDRRLRTLARKKDIDCEITALLGSVHDERRIREIMGSFKIETVYHAAAYKHVPIVEQNLFEGIQNNVLGTWHTVQAAIDARVQSFVLISTDKAVNPTSVMGATKRFAEIILQSCQSRTHDTCLSMVRFGNVLESSGSVVPLFKDQIRNGGPVTVTHRDIVRYFMTIPEAAQLVIQAGAMAHGGDVFVLDMGNPVKIDDLAHRMISLMGLTVRDESNPDGDIEIEYMGLRPAEKLYEELLIGANVAGTEHSRILRADEHSLSLDVVTALVGELQEAAAKQDYAKAREVLVRAVREYTPENGIDDLVWRRRTGTESDAQASTVVQFPKDSN